MKNSNEVTKITSSKTIIDFFQAKGLNFKTIPSFGKYVLKLHNKTEGRYNLVRSLDLEKIETPEEYLTEYSKATPYTPYLPKSVLEEVYKAAIFWGIECKPSNFTPEEIATIIIPRLYSIRCSVLYKKHIAPKSNTIYDRTVISYEKGVFSTLFFKR